MTTLSLELTDAQRAFVESQRRDKGFATAAEYVQDLIRQEEAGDMAELAEENRLLNERMERARIERPAEYAKAAAWLKQLIEEGLASGPGRRMDDAAWDDLRARCRANHAAKEV